ncbi:MAG: endolytic transglycosylase MltG [Deltaproteobacteria bacterium]|nr:endolytic transglycosylase MltG [Deltaproteobacteria bacterium]
MCYFDYQTFKKIKKIKKFFIYFIPLFLILYILFYAFTPQSYFKTPVVLFHIKRGYSLKTISFKLYKKNIVSNPYLFYFIGFITGYSRYIESGTYYVSLNEAPASIYYKFVNGKIATTKVTVIPGMNIFQIAMILNEKHVVKEINFIKASFNKDILLSIGIDKKSAEGVLYPDTYIFKINSTSKSVLKKMFNEFKLKTKNIKISYKDLIIASLIIKETNGKKNMKTVSSVFHNRLDIDMPLESDPTNIYAKDLSIFKKCISNARYKNNKKIINNINNSVRKNIKTKNFYLKFPVSMNPSYLNIKSKYNTYKNYGLPPSPIANPNIAAIIAAIHPLKTNYLYFIATKKGKTIFAKSLNTQNNNINKYLK